MATEIVRAPSTLRLAMPVSTPPGPSSAKSVTPSADSVWRQCFQRTGLESCADSNAVHSSPLVVGLGVDVGHHRDLGVADVGRSDRVAQPVAGRVP